MKSLCPPVTVRQQEWLADMPLDAHIVGPIFLQPACSARVSGAPGLMQAVAGLAIVNNNNTAAIPICENHVTGFIL